MKFAAYIIIGSVAFVMIAFFLLGKKSQNGSAIGLVDGRLAPCSGKPNCVNSEEGTPDEVKISPLNTNSLDNVKAAIVSLGGAITSSQDNYVSAEFTSGIFKFVDDVEVRLGDGRVQIRSASRVGYSDNGVNRTRVEAIRAALDQD
ncbi:MAG: DUF1499 domain-containing protein [Robiginitomaculum sp.]|nr:DUF1499 domain-containing protein [Robiginitomaculum sp.]